MNFTWIRWILPYLCLFGCTTKARPVALTVSGNFGLKKEIVEISKLYQKENPNVRINYNAGGSGFLKDQIERGVPVDIFISNSLPVMNALQNKGLLLPNTRREFLKNKMVLIVKKESNASFKFQDLTTNKIDKIGMGEPKTTVAGKYAEEVLTFFKIFNAVKTKGVFGEYSEQIVEYVEAEKADVGIVFLTDANKSDRVKIVAIAPENSHSPFIYSVAVLKNSKNINQARNFTLFLFEERAISVFQKSGYILDLLRK